ncbi:MAG: hypothetical protein IPM00_18260 [Tetrasphaera sp.]|nr:hypothetical protein [Tetrasphaera sp.]
MTNIDEARASQDRGQELLDQVLADQRQFEAFIVWLSDASTRAEQLAAYYSGQGQVDTQTILAADPEAITPPVASEDAAWEALAAHEDGLLRLLRIVTRELTSGLDYEDEADEDGDDADEAGLRGDSEEE